MDKKLEFNNLLSELMETAIKNNNILDKETVDRHFHDFGMTPDMYTHIYSYLKENKVYVSGLEDSFETSDFDITKEEELFVKMYYEELENLDPLTEEEELSLIRVFMENHDELSRKRLIESNLKIILDKIEHFINKGVTVGDLIQEGNLGLVEGIATFESLGDRILIDFKEHLNLSVTNAMQNAVNEYISSNRTGQHLADRANTLDLVARELSKELGREPSLQELSQHVSLSEEEVHNIMKYSLDALNSVDN